MSLYAAGNFIHPVETADVASLRARAVAHAIADDLQSPTTHTCLDIVADGRLASVWPNRVNFGTTTNSFALRSMTYHASRMVTARQDGVVLGTSPVARIVLNRSHSISGRMIESANKERGAIHFSLGAWFKTSTAISLSQRAMRQSTTLTYALTKFRMRGAVRQQRIGNEVDLSDWRIADLTGSIGTNT
jgi:hypothetical protein